MIKLVITMTQKIVRFRQWRAVYKEPIEEDLLFFHDWTDGPPSLTDNSYGNTAIEIWNAERTKKISPKHTFIWFEEFIQEFELQ